MDTAVVIIPHCKYSSTITNRDRNRYGMPDEAEKPIDVRGAERTELGTFTHLPAAVVDRARILAEVDKLLKKVEPHRAISAEDLVYSEELSEQVCVAILRTRIVLIPLKEFAQVYANALLQQPEVATSYFADEDCLLVALSTRVPIKRREEKEWKLQVCIYP